jgi:5-formyltetrahydrofolate cyclo-ligase
MLMLPVASSAEIDGFPRSKWGIPEPPVEPPREDGTYSGRIDVVVVPGVAFDRKCNRLGHGKGYYGELFSGGEGIRMLRCWCCGCADCFLERLTRSNAEKGASKPYTVVSMAGPRRCDLRKLVCMTWVAYMLCPQGLALSEQLVDSIPMDSFDLPLDALVTPDALYVRD